MILSEMQDYVSALLDDDSKIYWTNTLLTTLINASMFAVYTQIAQMNRGFFEQTATIGYVAGQELYTLPSGTAGAGFHRLTLVERTDIPPNMTILPIDESEKNDYAEVAGSDAQGYEKYFLSGNNIGFAPVPVSTIPNNIKLWFTATPAKLVNPGDTTLPEFSALHHECICQGALMRAAMRDKQLLALIRPIYAELLEMVKVDAQLRVTQEPRQIIDTDKNWS